MSTEFIQSFWPYATVVTLLFIMGIYCLLVTRNLIRVLIGIEILVKAVTLLLILVGYVTHNTAFTQTLVITLIVVEVVIMVVACGVVVSIFRHTRSIDTRGLE